MVGLRCLFAALLIAFAPVFAGAGERIVPAESGALAAAISGASPGDVLILAPGRHDGPVTLPFAITLDGRNAATIDGNGQGDVIRVTGPDVVVRGLTLVGSGNAHPVVDSAVKLDRSAERALIENNLMIENLVGVHVFGATDSVVRGNMIIGRQDQRMNDRGNGIYVWNAPGTLVEGNDIRFGRDGIFANASRENIFRDNILRDLRFAVHFMHTNMSEVSGNASIGNHLGYAIMFSNRTQLRGNLSLRDRSHGLMLNFANNADVSGNLIRGGTHEKCTFIYNAHRNVFVGNRFEGCDIGIHFTAGSERNALTGNAFIGNRTQVKYVGTRDMEWSHGARGNYWSDHASFDLDGDGIADAKFRPNDMMDHILWSQPAAGLLLGSPAVQLIRFAQAQFPATLPGGVRDSFPLMRAPEIAVPDDIARMEAEARPAWQYGRLDDAELDPLTSH
ncbi:nitrous oxide reductase family maturation protein NosD [Roseinatronobacter alkalisoli]|uniref:Nitrous oxide reductase family maturation protein NosD n=1 Tax=Roseinatronobacter alkalisoli TaxID=3028235 RepID=A0ABT5TB15_9RHOB|nr:nitrous oxide reductase family maturation protein NosD [Roseinatronobacter sp. HJB301]MDD7972308.1 nitrous oxide reductase family maturation protein NosD [Roseinatronobacter sp. HJB301]